MPRGRFPLTLFTLWMLAAAGCSDDTSDGGAQDGGADADASSEAGSDTSSDGAPDADVAPDALSQMPSAGELAPGWNILEPGGDTICARGTEYRFGVRPGTVNRLVIDFMGGGACWDALTCSFAEAIFNEDVEDLDQWVTGPLHGIYDTDNPDNPFADWWHVFIPYCTGDVHWGDATTTYAPGTANEVTIHHRGAVNTRAVLSWVQQNFADPEQLFVTGCSAGAYGSIMWAPHLIQMYPDARIDQFADSGAGVITESFFQDSFPSWHVDGVFPSWIPALDPARVSIDDMDIVDLYAGIANYYSGYLFSQYNTYLDENQTFYFQAMGGGDNQEWSQRMRAFVAETESRAPNYRAYIAPGEQHCIIGFDDFYTVDADGVALLDWIDDVVAGDPVDSVMCSDCNRPTGE